MADTNSSIKRKVSESSPEVAFSNDNLRRMLASDRDADHIFDSLLPEPYKEMSKHQWTTGAVVRQVASWLEESYSDKKIIDIGSGVGKFCILLSLRTQMQIFGIEQRKSLYEIGQRLRNENLFKRVNFIHGNMVDLIWEDYDVYYLYNPFQEHLVDNGWSRIDGDITFAPSLFGKYVDEIFRQLVLAEKGKVLITFHGYGGIVPGTWKIVHRTTIKNGDLCMWEKMV